MGELATLHGYGQRGNWQSPYPAQSGICRYCGKQDLGKGRSWCSEECRCEGTRRIVWSIMRDEILQRDVPNGCALCGATHPGIRAGNSYSTAQARYNRDLAGDVCYLRLWPWEVDHIVPVIDGGTDDPANLRTLCHKCHVESGVERRAAKKRPLVLDAVSQASSDQRETPQ